MRTLLPGTAPKFIGPALNNARVGIADIGKGAGVEGMATASIGFTKNGVTCSAVGIADPALDLVFSFYSGNKALYFQVV